MRILKWNPQERVDLPDLTQMSYLVLAEFRRTVRGLLIGPNLSPPADYQNFIVRGFAVEPQAVPDATVRVRLDPGGANPLGFAIGSENLGSRIDFGQLIGGDGSAGELEGNATYTLDFSAQPPGVYTVQMRFVYADGSNDNRAFWDEAANSEFIAATNTRTLPTIELRLSGGASAEWIDLASVTWGGATIVAGNITDLRTWAFEGAAPFQQSTQNGSGGVPDFSRSSARGTNGQNEVYPALRNLARQIQDLKGQDASGNFNWWARPFHPFENTNSQPFSAGAVRTKTLRTVDTATYTVGDGVTTFGDFNGANGLEDCLNHLEALGTQMPDGVTVVLKSHDEAGFVWNVNTSHTLGTGGDPKALRIIGQCGSAFPGIALLNLDAIPNDGIAIFVNGYLEVHNVGNNDPVETANNILIFVADTLVLDHCRLFGRESSGASSNPVVALLNGGQGSRISDCRMRGRVRVDPAASSSSQNGIAIERVVIENGCIDLGAHNTGASTFAIENVTIRDCQIVMGETHGWGIRGAVDCNNNRMISVERSLIVYVPDVDGVHARLRNGVAPSRIYVRDVLFGVDATAPAHTVDNGGNLANGTGWGVYIEGTNANRATNCHVSGCRFSLSGIVDAGCVRFLDSRACQATSNEVDLCGHGTGGTMRFNAFDWSVSGGSKLSVEGVCSGNIVHRWLGSANTFERTCALYTLDVLGLAVFGNTFDGRDSAGGALTGRAATGCAWTIDGDCEAIRFVGNHLTGWEGGSTTASRTIRLNGGSIVGSQICDNTILGGGNWVIDLDSGTLNTMIINGNTTSGDKGIRVIDAAATVVSNNRISVSGTNDAISWGTPTNQSVCMGNSSGGNIRSTGGVGVPRGYNEAGQDLNFVNAYV